MHELAFADAARPTPVVVLTLPLRDYSLGHELLLQSQRNPLLLLGEEQFNALPWPEQVAALRRAVWLCANTAAQNRREPWLRVKLHFWLWRTRRANYPLALAEFRNYLAACRQLLPMPDRGSYLAANGLDPNDEPPGRLLGSPWLARLYNFVSQHCAIPESDRWDFPYALAAMLYQTQMETTGGYHIENSAEAEERIQMEKITSEVAAEEAAMEARSGDARSPASPSPIGSEALTPLGGQDA